MPQNQDRKQRDFSRYDALSTEELSEILRLDSETPEGNGLDIDTLLYITGVLAERKKTTNTGKTAQEAWKSFQQNYLDSEETTVAEEKTPVKTRTPWIRRIIAAAAALVLIISLPLTARALSWEDICTAVVQWAKETFSFVMGNQRSIDGPVSGDSRQYDSLQDALRLTDQDFISIPTWIPDGYVLEKVDVDETPFQRNYIALYRNGEQLLTISVYVHNTSNPQNIEINDNLLDTYIVSGTTYYIISNNSQIRAIWQQGSYECYISGDLTINELKQMINSVPEG